MKQTITALLIAALLLGLFGCGHADTADIAATTAPVYELSAKLCQGTELKVQQIITENVSCLHDYTLQPGQLKALESAQLTVISGAGLEDFLDVSLPQNLADASVGIDLLCDHADHSGHSDHHHEQDPHIWLAPENGKKMAKNIYTALCIQFPEWIDTFSRNLEALDTAFEQLISYGEEQLSSLSCKELITFHDGFHYLANAYGLSILHAMEEESGSEASARELINICSLVESNRVPAVFTEINGSDRAAAIVSRETGAKVYALDTGMSGGYFEAMYHNIDILKEALT